MSGAANLTEQGGPPGPREFDWPLANEAEELVRGYLARFLEQNTFALQLTARMRDETGTDFFEWIDHLVLAPVEETHLKTAGFAHDPKAETPNGELVYEHPRATLPRVLLSRHAVPTVALRPEYIADFVASNHLRVESEGEPCSKYRRVLVREE